MSPWDFFGLRRSRFKKSENSLLISHIYEFAVIYKFLGDFGEFFEEIVFLKELVKFGEIRNIEDLICF